MKIALVGDVALFGRYSLTSGTSGLRYFEPVSKHLQQFDHVIANLETPFVSHGKPVGAKSAYINSNPKDVRLLEYLGIDVVNLANNHIFDFGKAGYDCTVKTLANAGISYFGAEGLSVELSDSTAKVGLHGYCSYNTNPLGVARTGKGINSLGLPRVLDTMRAFDQAGFLNIISVHSGWEHINYPSLQDIQMARALARECPFVYYGHHPHVIQGVEERSGSVIAYSLGNFCFDDVYTDGSDKPLIRQSENNRTGLILELEVEGKRVISFSTTVIRLGDDVVQLNPEGADLALEQYSQALAEDPASYELRRRELIDTYLMDRKSARDLTWYMKRLRPRYAEILLRSKLNALAHYLGVERHLRGTLK